VVRIEYDFYANISEVLETCHFIFHINIYHTSKEPKLKIVYIQQN